MKMTKKILCILLVCIMVSFSLSAAAFAEESTSLRFDEDGQFKIMIFSDSQDNEDLEETTTQLMKEALAKYKPDLVVYLGDNTVSASYETHYMAIEAILAPTIEANVPFALVFGNHDQEGVGGDKEALLEMYQEIGGELCLTTDAAPEIYGCGNSNLPILSSEGSEVAFNLWFIDSGSSNPDTEVGGYDYVREDQIAWYEETAAELKAANNDETVPSILFQHIIIPEIYDAIYPISFPINIDGYCYMGSTYFPVPSFSKHTGIILEPCSPSYISAGQFASWLETGDIIASFHGHDHRNDFTATWQGVDIVNVPTVGGSAYNDDISRGVGLITLDESDLTTYSYETVYMFDLALEEGSQIPEVDGGRSTAYYRLVKIFRSFLDGIHKLLSFG